MRKTELCGDLQDTQTCGMAQGDMKYTAVAPSPQILKVTDKVASL
jgi:hypothetical protein